jgi:hypothetical protein
MCLGSKGKNAVVMSKKGRRGRNGKRRRRLRRA